MSMLFSVKGCVGTLLLVVMVGCSSTPRVMLPEPKDVPREKWSDAMLVRKPCASMVSAIFQVKWLGMKQIT